MLVVSVVIFGALYGVYTYYTDVMQQQWTERADAFRVAQQKASLSSYEKAQKFVWGEDHIYWTFIGKNKNNDRIIVWVQDEKRNVTIEKDKPLRIRFVHEGICEEQIRSRFTSEHVGAKIVRLLPGVLYGEEVWQCFYQQNTHHYYCFYRFTDGTKIGDTYTIPEN